MRGLHKARKFLDRFVEVNRRTSLDIRERRRFKHMPAEYWDRLPETVFGEHEPIFVLSTGRCGTALLTKIFSHVPGVLCYHTPSPEFVYSQKSAYEEGLEKFETFKAIVSAARFELLADCAARGRRYVETNCRITFFAPHLYDLFPRARFVHLVRHPGNFVCSGVRRNYYQGHYGDIGRIKPIAGPAADTWGNMTPLERCAWLWNETNQYIESFKADRDQQRILTLKAEDLFSRPEATQDLCRYCQLPEPEKARVEKWIKRPVNRQLDNNGLPPYKLWDEARRVQVRRWATLADQYEYEV